MQFESAIIAAINFDEICQATHEYALGQRPLFMHDRAFAVAFGRPDHPALRGPQANLPCISCRA
jgi:hypothetical protein